MHRPGSRYSFTPPGGVPMQKILTLASLALVVTLHAQAPGKIVPTVDQILSLERVASPQISPDGRLVAYMVGSANWEENAFDSQIWIVDSRTGQARQLTRSKKSSQSPAWSPDGSMLAFISDRTDKRQLYVIDMRGGEARALTALDDGVGSFRWAPGGKSIAYAATEPKSAAAKQRDDKFGEFQVVNEDHRMTHLFVIDIATKASRALTSGSFTVGAFEWSPDGKSIAFDHRVNPSPGSSGSDDISIVTVADGAVRKLVTQDGPDSHPIWSPDGSRIAFETTMANPAYYYGNRLIATIPAAGGTPEPLTSTFDENASPVDCKATGICFTASERTWSYLSRVDPATKAMKGLVPEDLEIGSSFSLSKDGSRFAFLRADSKSMNEVYVAPISTPASSVDSSVVSGFSRTSP